MSAIPEVARSIAKPAGVGPGQLARVVPYVAIARPDHWFKNVFMVLGLVLAFFCHPNLFTADVIWPILWAVATTCIIASSNYVLNEVLDAPTDRSHPVKRFRPVPSGQVLIPVALVEWIALGVVGLFMASFLGRPFFFSCRWRCW